MAKIIKQFRWRRESDQTSYSNYINGEAFSGCDSIVQLGIQALPGTMFRLNGAHRPIRIGASGIFDLEAKNGMRISDLVFEEESMKRNGQYIIVDILNEEREEG